MRVRLCAALVLGMCGLGGTGCLFVPAATQPEREGSIGLPSRGVLVGADELPAEGEGYHFLRRDDRRFATRRFVRVLKKVAQAVARDRPGADLVLGDLSRQNGGFLLPHLSHRTGRDADVLLFLTTLDGAPVPSPGFVRVGMDGLAFDPKGRRFLRFDVERQWLAVKQMLEDDDARVQWIFAHRRLSAMLLDWARARGERADLLARAEEVLSEPHPGGAHDDHLHVRTACSTEEVSLGCIPSGPSRSWIAIDRPLPPADRELVAELLAPLSPSRTEVSLLP